MDRQTGLILAAVSLVLCACPGVGLCVFGGLLSVTPLNDQGIDPVASTWVGGLMVLCGFGLILIPIAIGLITLMRKEEKTLTPQDLDEELPPAI